MKKFALFVITMLMLQNVSFARPTVFSEDGIFGLKNEQGETIVDAKYKKLIRLGESSWIMQSGSKFGIIDDNGTVLVDAKYSKADRILGKFAKFAKGDKFGIFDEKGFVILPVEYSSIDLLFGGMFLTCKNYKYGVTDFNGQPILDNIFDDIYMPKRNKMVIVYNGQQFEIESSKDGELTLPLDIVANRDDVDFTITELIQKPAATTGYYSVTATNYLLKIISSISPAYEQTIDELMFSQGADAANIIMKFTWLPKFPIVYAKKYYQNLAAPNNGPLGGVKSNLRRHLSQ